MIRVRTGAGAVLALSLGTSRALTGGRNLLDAPGELLATCLVEPLGWGSLVFLAGTRDGSGEQQQLGVIVVTSPSPAEGKTSTAANLAAASAEEVARDVELAREAQLDLVRVHAHVARPELYEAADALGSSLPTVKTHMTRLFEKTETRGHIAFVAAA